jgi:hypothetical protein
LLISFKNNGKFSKYQSKGIRSFKWVLKRCLLSKRERNSFHLNFSALNLELNSKLLHKFNNIFIVHMLTVFMFGCDESSKQTRHKRKQGWQIIPFYCCWTYLYFSLWHTTGNSYDSAEHFSGTVPKLNYNLGLKISV